MRNLLSAQVGWIVGPPKVGKTVIAQYVAYLKWLAFAEHDTYPPSIMTVDGGPECARTVDLAIESPHLQELRVLIFENPFGAAGARPNGVFLRQLALLINARPELHVLVTTRPRGYVDYADDIAPLAGYTTPLALSDWYAPEALTAYAESKLGESFEPGRILHLGAPALIDDYALHQVTPGTPAQRETLRKQFGSNIENVTLDKLAVLRAHEELRRLACLLRLQEHASTLPTIDEISALAAYQVDQHPHLGLVAVEYEFDGLRRLRFEHSTAREAADLVLSALADSDFAELRELGSHATMGNWIDRALELWLAQQDIIRGDWAAFQNRREDVRVALAADALALSTTHIASAVEMISEISYDAWTAQDVAYEIVAAWPDYAAESDVERLASQLIDDGETDGAYAILEALLYVRSKEVAALWGQLDAKLLSIAAATEPPTRQLLLCLDALAWRPPPEWHQLGVWAKIALEKLSPGDDAWGFVRFMAGYHPEGIEYLRRRASPEMQALVAKDQGIEWTAGQADVASWLVRWHYIHQCRARAQLARQPWIDQQFLCQSFHAEMTHYDHDQRVALLIHSMRDNNRDPDGWGFFLAENIRAVAPGSYGERTQNEARLTLRQSAPGATGVLAAVLTYSVSTNALADIQDHFRNPLAVSRLMAALTDGLVVSGTRLLEPRFSYRRSLAEIYSCTGLDWADIKAAIPAADLLTADGVFDVEGLIRRLQDAARVHPFKEDPSLDALLIEIMRRVRHGDLTVLSPTEHRSPTKSDIKDYAYQSLIESTVAYLATER
ncbi:hypothetical protein OG809_33215 [Kribbella soli]